MADRGLHKDGFLSVNDVSRRLGGQCIVDQFSLVQERFQKIALSGETGSGKTSVMKMIAGLIQPDSGNIIFEGKHVEGPAEKLVPGHPRIAFLSQQFELRNNYRVEEILEYANTLSQDESHLLFDVCQITHLLKRRTDQVSGGERQRIAIARLLISSPSLLLLDEPYSNLDMIHKNLLKAVIRDIGERLKITCMLVSHDPSDTLSWADEIVVLKNGTLVQKGTPAEIYYQPVNEYVAGLFGKYHSLQQLQKYLTLPDQMYGRSILRPEELTIEPAANDQAPAIVNEVQFLGSSFEIEVKIGIETITVRSAYPAFKKGDKVKITLR
jgi:ABC-type sugar transport system ATPase subunit